MTRHRRHQKRICSLTRAQIPHICARHSSLAASSPNLPGSSQHRAWKKMRWAPTPTPSSSKRERTFVSSSSVVTDAKEYAFLPSPLSFHARAAAEPVLDRRETSCDKRDSVPDASTRTISNASPRRDARARNKVVRREFVQSFSLSSKRPQKRFQKEDKGRKKCGEKYFAREKRGGGGRRQDHRNGVHKVARCTVCLLCTCVRVHVFVFVFV